MAAPAPSGDFDAGFDVKYGVTSGLTWDFTVNTDFSQVEADEQQVNLSRFSLFFPEKRDFFLENSGIFQFGAGGRLGGGRRRRRRRRWRQNALAGHAAVLQPAHRPVGRGEAIPILAGTRLTGRRARIRRRARTFSSASRCGASPSTNFTALRCAATCSPTRTSASILLNKDEAGAALQPRGAASTPTSASAFLQPQRLRGQDRSRRSATVAGQRRRLCRARRASTTSRGRWQFRGHFNVDRRAFQRRDGLRAASWGRQRLTYDGSHVPAAVAVEARHPRDAAALADRRRSRARTAAASSRVTRTFTCRSISTTARFVEIGVNPNVEDIRAPFTINSARGVRVNPAATSSTSISCSGTRTAPHAFSFNSPLLDR